MSVFQHSFPVRLSLQLLFLANALFTLSGCLTASKYRMAKQAAPPAQPLCLHTSTPPLDLTLQTIIVFKGPGSWKDEARWDEYVVQLANHGDRPIVIESAALTDLQGNPQNSGDNPWKLEKLSYTNWDKYGKAGVTLLAGAGVTYVYAGVALYTAYSGSLAAADAMIAAFPVLLVADVAAVAVMNHHNKQRVQQEFSRRRLALPLTLAPGATVHGSFFFPMAPGPQQLTLKGRAGDAPLELVLELKPLAGLHLKPSAGK